MYIGRIALGRMGSNMARSAGVSMPLMLMLKSFDRHAIKAG